MFYRQKLLLALLETFDGFLASTDFQKYLFLYTRLCEREHSYEFAPYNFGCFSFQSYADKSKLVAFGYLKDVPEWTLALTTQRHADQLKRSIRQKLELFKARYGALRGNALLRHVYEKYPYYAQNSLVAAQIVGPTEMEAIKRFKEKKRTRLFATIGYEGVPVKTYINKLIQNDVRTLVDVRSNPQSRKFGFSKSRLSDLLEKVGIQHAAIAEKVHF
ncbi:MAG: DUF488 family protein [Gammaproteobacteria bacterium]|nr:DUF488 family protein [Gammaproteobacteria bacterium]